MLKIECRGVFCLPTSAGPNNVAKTCTCPEIVKLIPDEFDYLFRRRGYHFKYKTAGTSFGDELRCYGAHLCVLLKNKKYSQLRTVPDSNAEEQQKGPQGRAGGGHTNKQK